MHRGKIDFFRRFSCNGGGKRSMITGSAAFIGGRQESSDVLDKYKLPAESKPGAPEKKLTEQNQVLPQQTHTQKRQSPPPPLRKVPRQSAATHSAVSAFENRKSQQATVHSLEAEGQQTSGLAESTDKSSLPSAGSTSGGANSAMGELAYNTETV